MSERIKFRYFSPVSEVQNYIRTKVVEITRFAPYDSRLSTAVTKLKESYACQILVRSKAGAFRTLVTGPNPQSAIESAHTKIMEQLKKWKHQRFAPTLAYPL